VKGGIMEVNKSLVRFCDLKGVEVKNLDNEYLGKIEEIAIDKVHGKVAYVVLSVGGILGMGDKLFAMPWHIFNYDSNENCFHINVSKEKLGNSSGFDKEHWPDTYDSWWTGDVSNENN
jgi:sporulation protein YlmC with PRC-barrel domain